MLGICNQLLACIALCAATTLLVNQGRGRYAWVTLGPLLFVGVATETAGWKLLTGNFRALIASGKPALVSQGYILGSICVLAMAALVFVFADAASRWRRAWRAAPARRAG